MRTKTIFKVPRIFDRQVVEKIKEINEELEINGSLQLRPFDEAESFRVRMDQLESNSFLNEVLPLNESCIHQIGLNPRDDFSLLTVRRLPSSLFDEVTVTYETERPPVSQGKTSQVIALAKQKFRELKFDSAFGGFNDVEISKYYESREATLSRLETVSVELLFNAQKRLAELDKEFQRRTEEQNASINAEKSKLKAQYDAVEQSLHEREEAFRKSEAEFDTNESKYLRRQLRKDMLEKLQALSVKFELTAGTRKLRWPLTAFIIVFLLFFGTMTVLTFSQGGEILEKAGQDLSKMNWWQFTLLTIKQFGFVAAFLGGAWFYIKWNDKWFRQHADAEFMFKQLELDINRASWVVEMALEWKEEKGMDIPAELLDRLTRNLFSEPKQTDEKVHVGGDLATTILGSAANVKIKAANGTEVELDRKGIQKAMQNS